VLEFIIDNLNVAIVKQVRIMGLNTSQFMRVNENNLCIYFSQVPTKNIQTVELLDKSGKIICKFGVDIQELKLPPIICGN
jgi:hypothetical protein